MVFILWLIILGLIIFGFFNSAFYWIAGFFYVLAVFIRGFTKWENHKDWLILNQRNEKNKLDEVLEEIAHSGMVYSGRRTKRENDVKQDFEFERKKAYRKLWVDLVDCLFLK